MPRLTQAQAEVLDELLTCFGILDDTETLIEDQLSFVDSLHELSKVHAWCETMNELIHMVNQWRPKGNKILVNVPMAFALVAGKRSLALPSLQQPQGDPHE